MAVPNLQSKDHLIPGELRKVHPSAFSSTSPEAKDLRFVWQLET